MFGKVIPNSLNPKAPWAGAMFQPEQFAATHLQVA